MIWPKELEKEICEVGVNYILAGSWTSEGVKLWWDRPRKYSNGYTPREILDRGDYQEVIELAVSGMEMNGM